MTELSRQLGHLRSVTAPLQSRVTKRKPSFLFDSKQAADIDLETIYVIGLEGFNELKRIDPRLVVICDC